MSNITWTVSIPRERVQEFRDLLSELNKDLSGLAERAREVGYHQERMWLQPNQDESAQLIVSLELNEGVGPAEFFGRLGSYESEFTRWWNPRFASFGRPISTCETLLAWDDEA